MKVDIHPPMAEVLRQSLDERIKSCQPRLSAEFEDVVDPELFESLLKVVFSWAADFLLIFVSFDDESFAQISDKSTLRELLGSYFLRGMTVTIVDPTNGGGCTVDWEGFENDTIASEVLVVAWGEHESISQTLVDKHSSGTVFRGN